VIEGNRVVVDKIFNRAARQDASIDATNEIGTTPKRVHGSRAQQGSPA